MGYIVLFHKSQETNVIIDEYIIPFIHVLTEEEQQEFITGKVDVANYYIYSGGEIGIGNNEGGRGVAEQYPELIGKAHNDVEAFQGIDGIEVIKF